MEITGTIFKILPAEEVTLGDGTKRMKGGFVIMRDGEYAKTVAFELFGEDRLEMLNGLELNMPVKVSFIASSREGKEGRYFTSLRCIGVTPLVATTYVNQAETVPGDSSQNTVPQSQNRPFGELHPDEQLPFENDLPFF